MNTQTYNEFGHLEAYIFNIFVVTQFA